MQKLSGKFQGPYTRDGRKGRKAGLMKLKTVGHGLRAACCRFGFAACCGELFGGSGIFFYRRDTERR